MPETAIESAPAGVPTPAGTLTGGDRIALLQMMMRARVTEQRARRLVGGELRAAPADRWHGEAIGAAAAAALRPSDRLVAPGRYIAAHLGRGDSRSVGSSTVEPDLVPIAVGVAAAVAVQGGDDIVMTLLDDGAMASEQCREAMRIATERHLPLVLVVERPPRPAVWRGGAALEVHPLLGEAVDAYDPEQILGAVAVAVDRARAGHGPALVACAPPQFARGPRRRGRFVRDAERGPRNIRDPIERYARRLVRGHLPRDEIEWALRSAEDEVTAWRH